MGAENSAVALHEKEEKRGRRLKKNRSILCRELRNTANGRAVVAEKNSIGKCLGNDSAPARVKKDGGNRASQKSQGSGARKHGEKSSPSQNEAIGHNESTNYRAGGHAIPEQAGKERRLGRPETLILAKNRLKRRTADGHAWERILEFS